MWLIETMSAEKIINGEKESPTCLNNIESTVKKSSGRVDINNLIARAREQKNKENRINYIFFSIFISLVFVVGIIFSL